MDDTDNARMVAERYCDAWSANDLDGILGSYAEDFTLHYFGSNPFSGDHVGKEAAIDVLLATGAKAPRRLMAIDSILAGPDAAVVVAREEITTSYGPEEIRRVLRFGIEGDHLAECWLYEENQPLIDLAWS